jgi:hypothetical protein
VSEVQCFLIVPTNHYRRWLRRYSTGLPCGYVPYESFHTASRPFDVIESKEHPVIGDFWHHEDDRWPVACDKCGWRFNANDHWQLTAEQIYIARDGRQFTLREAPPGAMWFASWYPKTWVGLDGKCLVVRLPDMQDWIVDGPSADGGRWTRGGPVPTVTAFPSIRTPNYHGWLIAGSLRQA